MFLVVKKEEKKNRLTFFIQIGENKDMEPKCVIFM